MAKVRSNVIVRGLSGSLGGLVFRHLRDGRTILCSKPDFSDRKFSPEQTAHQRRFRVAASYAQSAAKLEPLYAELAAGTLKTAYNLALADWFHPPVIHEVSWQAGVLRIAASDDVRVKRVRVKLEDAEGEIVEAGEAQPVEGSSNQWWTYLPQQLPAGKVLVEAEDLAGNVARGEVGGRGLEVGGWRWEAGSEK